jgi:hypothetical protein
MTIIDAEGVDPDSILFTIQRSTISGIDSLDIFDSGVIWSEPNLSFSSDIPFVDGETVTVRIVRSYDLIGNAMESFPSATFRMDMTPPVVSAIMPAPGSMVLSASPVISFNLFDAISGLDITMSALVLTV